MARYGRRASTDFPFRGPQSILCGVLYPQSRENTTAAVYFPVTSFRSERSLSGITTATHGASAVSRLACHSTVCGVPGLSVTFRLDGSAERLSVRMAIV